MLGVYSYVVEIRYYRAPDPRQILSQPTPLGPPKPVLPGAMVLQIKLPYAALY
jgi:hypothetical protein